MRLFFKIFILIVAISALYIFLKYNFLQKYGVEKINGIEVGGEMPFGPGKSTFAPYLEIPIGQKFYINVVEKNLWCSNEDCGLDGSIIKTLGGWLEVEDKNQSEIKAEFGLDLPGNKNIESIVIVGNGSGKIMGIYLNKQYKDVISILKKDYYNLVDFASLQGVKQYKSLKVGQMAPLKPGDNIANLFSSKVRSVVSEIPQDKKFYLYGIYKKQTKFKNDYICFLGGCRHPYPDDPHDFIFDEIDKMGGWFLSNDNDNTSMAKLFGLKQEDVVDGKSSLVVLTDSKGILIAIYPEKTMNDAITILSQHPDLINIKEIYQN